MPLIGTLGAGSKSAYSVIGPYDGLSSARALKSAQEIKTATGTTTSGYYWIDLPTAGLTQVYCDMSGATAWMLAMRARANDSTFGYNSAYWTNTTGLNDTGNPLTDINIKNNNLWRYWTVNNMRMTGSSTVSNYNSNPTASFGTFSNTMVNIFNAGSNIYDGQINWGRGSWNSWFTSITGTSSSVFDNQPNCNRDGINVNGVYHYMRVGITYNNEGDCNTNDAGIGMGGWRNGLGDYNFVANRWNPDQIYPAHGWLWVN